MVSSITLFAHFSPFTCIFFLIFNDGVAEVKPEVNPEKWPFFEKIFRSKVNPAFSAKRFFEVWKRWTRINWPEFFFSKWSWTSGAMNFQKFWKVSLEKTSKNSPLTPLALAFTYAFLCLRVHHRTMQERHSFLHFAMSWVSYPFWWLPFSLLNAKGT